ncbi:hypothetical protein LNA01_02680 [Companilactobacillus nantensis]|nr:hypothetical protein LNA01_02680 [Companilactobacillus nantensis]
MEVIPRSRVIPNPITTRNVIPVIISNAPKIMFIINFPLMAQLFLSSVFGRENY